MEDVGTNTARRPGNFDSLRINFGWSVRSLNYI